MITTFAFIAAFAIGSVDAIVTGGADFGPANAYATEYQPARVSAVQPLATPDAAEPVEEDVAELKTVTADAVDYSYTSEILLGGPEVVIIAEPILIESVIPELIVDGEKAEF